MAIDRKEGARSDADQEMEGCLDNAPLNLIVIGMAGSGKTTFIQVRFADHSFPDLTKRFLFIFYLFST